MSRRDPDGPDGNEWLDKAKPPPVGVLFFLLIAAILLVIGP